MLSDMLFLDHYFRFLFQVQISYIIDHLSDGDKQGLLKCTGFAMDRSWDNPNGRLASEYDLDSGIIDILHSQRSPRSKVQMKCHAYA